MEWNNNERKFNMSDGVGTFAGGIMTGMVITLALGIVIMSTSESQENSGYKDKMILSYHCPGKQYERQLFNDLVERSGIQTNFVNKEVTMDAHRIRYRLTNPE